jgi:S-adenosylmethionine:tRNA ribosyltransferase-isomerase
MLRTQFWYDLPESSIAQNPMEPRDHSRLLRVDRKTQTFSDYHFYDLPTLLHPGDLLVLNNTKVLPVRLFGKKTTGGEVEVLLTKKLNHESKTEIWQALTRPGLKNGQTVIIKNDTEHLELTCVGSEGYARLVETSLTGTTLLSALEKLGTLPTPPYIREFVGDPERYQTVFATRGGSAAAPTAGLHFTPQLFDALHAAGVRPAELTLHVGIGTFLPVKEDQIENHVMHSEWYELPAATAAAINETKKNGGRVIPVGTTSMRTLESVASKQRTAEISEAQGETDIFLYPPHQFKLCDAMITNFHLPESTLLMLISAFTTEPQASEEFKDFQQSFIGKAYQHAIESGYRFFSFGDAMLIE